MEINYTPKKDFTGTIKIKMPRYTERVKLLKEISIKPSVSESATVEANGIQASNLDTAIFMAESVQKFILGVDVKFIETGLEIKSLEELECYQEGVALINEIATVLFHGVSLGKN